MPKTPSTLMLVCKAEAGEKQSSGPLATFSALVSRRMYSHYLVVYDKETMLYESHGNQHNIKSF